MNVASINYHFGSKGNLYWATVGDKHNWLDEGIKEISERTDDISEVIVQAYAYLMEDPAAIRTAMKMMLTDGVPEPEGEYAALMSENMGPPGSEHIMRVLKITVPDTVSDEAIDWAMKSLFGSLIHWATMSASCKLEHMKKRMPEFEGDGIKQILCHHTAAIVEYLKTNPDVDLTAKASGSK